MYSGLSFNLNKSFVNSIPEKESKSAIGAVVLMRTYSRNIYENGNFVRTETYKDIVERVVNGTFSLLKDHLNQKDFDEKYTPLAERFYHLIYESKMTPPGRGFWAMGTELVHKKKMSLALVNCTFVSTNNIFKTGVETFAYVMDALMLGVGVGFDDMGAGKIFLHNPLEVPNYDQLGVMAIVSELKLMELESIRKCPSNIKYISREIEYCKNGGVIHVVQDDREGWVDAMRVLLDSYISKKEIVLFDYSKVRPKGIFLKTFGGTSSGPLPLAEGIATIRYLLEKSCPALISSLNIVDICNIIATIVVAGNVRRSAQIFISSNPESVFYKDIYKDKYKYRAGWCWSSNNSVKIGSDFDLNKIMEGIVYNGEPGMFNADLVQRYSRMCDEPTNLDLDANGTNPCGEITLVGEHEIGSREKNSAGGETCNLFDTYPSNYPVENMAEQFESDLYLAVLYCKIVTLIPPHWKSSAEIQNKNRRFGISQTGIYTFLAKHNLSIEDAKPIWNKWYKAVKAYDVEISNLLGIPTSIKVTTIKPSGTTSICGGILDSGMHASPSDYFIRNVRISNEKEDFIRILKAKGYLIEPDVYQPDYTSVISFPCKTLYGAQTKRSITVEQQYELLVALQNSWSDNQVSCTVSFRESEAIKLPVLHKKYKDVIKSISFLKINTTAYPQAPQIEITEERYEELMAPILPVSCSDFMSYAEIVEEELDNYCTGDKCQKL